MIAYRRSRVFARFYFSPEDAPRYPVLAGLGEVRELAFSFFGPRRPMLHGVGLWEVVENAADREVLRGTFGEQDELTKLLEQVRDRALPAAEVLFDDAGLMRAAIRRRSPGR